MRPILLAAALAACGPPPYEPPPPDAFPPLRGPGGPAVTFDEADLFVACATLKGEGDRSHHNLVHPYRGHLVHPWAPEWGIGGLTLYEADDPCAPTKAGESPFQLMRETHAMGFVHLAEGPHAGDWAVTNRIGLPTGVAIWDLSDPANPRVVAEVPLEGSTYPDSYSFVTLSLFWQYPWIYVASSGRGVYVIDATDPRAPVVVAEQVKTSAEMVVGGVFALGNRLLLTSAEQALAAVLDISDPAAPQPIPGGVFEVSDRDGVPRKAYHGNLTGNLAWFARKDNGSGPIVYDLSDPGRPRFVGDLPLPGSGGYVFYANEHVFLGASSTGYVIDARDPADMRVVGEGALAGDLDTVTPWGNAAVFSVDDEAEGGVASVIMPWRTTPDDAPPRVIGVDPPDGATGVAPTARIGVGFDDILEPSTVFEGSLRLWHEDGTFVRGFGSGQENTASYAPAEPLRPGRYTIEVMADGIRDLSGNAVATTVTSHFEVAP